MKIGIKNLKIACIIGTLKEERESEQDIFLDLEVVIEAPKKDLLEHSLDYTALAQFSQEVANRGFFLLESLAEILLEELFNVFPVESARLTIKKFNTFLHADYAYVSLEKEKNYDLYSDFRSLQEIGR